MTTTPIMPQLKEKTADLHHQAERAPLQQALAKRQLPLEGYKAFLAQRMHVHAALEPALAELLRARPELAAAVQPDVHFQTPRLREDFDFLQIGGDELAALPATQEAVKQIERASTSAPLELLGMFYVFEGSNNGARFLARGLRKAYAFEGTEGTRYFDPYGERQPELWAAFRHAMNAIEFNEDEQAQIMAGANLAFSQIMAVDAEIWERTQTSSIS